MENFWVLCCFCRTLYRRVNHVYAQKENEYHEVSEGNLPSLGENVRRENTQIQKYNFLNKNFSKFYKYPDIKISKIIYLYIKVYKISAKTRTNSFKQVPH